MNRYLIILLFLFGIIIVVNLYIYFYRIYSKQHFNFNQIPLYINVQLPNIKNNILLLQNKTSRLISQNNRKYCNQKKIDYIMFDNILIWNVLYSIIKQKKYKYIMYLSHNLMIIDFSKDITRIIQQAGDNEMIICRDENNHNIVSEKAVIFKYSEWTLYKLRQLCWYKNNIQKIILDQIYTSYKQQTLSNVKNTLDIGLPYMLSGICIYNEHSFNSTKSSFIRNMESANITSIDQIKLIYPWVNIEGYKEVESDITKISNKVKNRKICKNIFQTMETTLIPQEMYDKCIKVTKQLNPDYNYYFFTSLDCRTFIKNNFSNYIYDAYDKLLPGAYKADFWRYCILYTYGGCYIDSWVNNVKGFDYIIEKDDEFICPIDYNKYSFWQGYLLVSPQNNFLSYLINNISNDIHNNKYGVDALDITGPNAIGKYLNKFLNNKEMNIYNVGKINGYKFLHLEITIPYTNKYITYNFEKICDCYLIDKSRLNEKLTGKEYYSKSYKNKRIYKINYNIEEKIKLDCESVQKFSINHKINVKPYIPLIWSKGWGYYVSKYNINFDQSYFSLDTETVLNIKKFKKIFNNIKTVAWVRMSTKYVNDIDNFSKFILPTLTEPIILITSDGDLSIPSGLNSNTTYNILNHNMIIKWYTQNYDNTIIHEKLLPIPIGFDLHSKNKNFIEIYNDIRQIPKISTKTFKIFCDSHLSGHNKDRNNMFNLLKNNDNLVFLDKRVSYTDILSLYSKYKFVISPKGNGLDCHRTWEALYMGAIVITCTKELKNLFVTHNLPVVVLDDWNDITYENMKIWDKLYTPLISKCINKIINPEYWINNFYTLSYDTLPLVLYNIKHSDICVMTTHNNFTDIYYQYCCKINREYCIKNNYDFRGYIGNTLNPKLFDPHWDRYQIILNLSEKYKYILYIDSDAIIIKDNIKIENFIRLMDDKNFLISKDYGSFNRILPINSGVILIRICKQSINDIIYLLNNSKQFYKQNQTQTNNNSKCGYINEYLFRDQCGFEYNHKYFKNKIKIIDLKILQDNDINNKNCFIFHATGMNNNLREKYIKNYLVT
jgi:mannosyltransferase OCH1-like enzyme